MTDDLRYSGPKSKRFWKCIDKIKNECAASRAYIAACALQEHERRIFQIIRSITRPSRARCRAPWRRSRWRKAIASPSPWAAQSARPPD